MDDAENPLVLYDGGWNEDDALLTGTLVLDGNCLYVDHKDPPGGTDRTVLIALSNKGTSWDATKHELKMPGKTYALGDEVAFGGGAGGPELIERIDWERAPDPACDATNLWIAGLPN